MGPTVESGEIVLRMPLPDDIPLQLIAIRDIGRISVAFLLGAAEAPGGAIEIAGDERTGSQIAEAFGAYAGLPARYEALPRRSSTATRICGPAWLRSGAWTLPAANR